MKFTAITDIHLHNYKKFDKNGSRLNNCLNVIIDVFEYNHNNDIDITLFPGDLFDSEKLLPTVVVNKTIRLFRDMFKKYPEQKWICISGNHDYATKNLPDSPAETALKHLSIIFEDRFYLIDNQHYIFSDSYLEGLPVYGIPYYEYKEHFIDSLITMNKNIGSNRPRILMIHQTPEHSNPNIPFDISPRDPLFDDFDLILCGHIHKRERLSNKFWLVGSPLHKSLEDEGQEKGFMVFDTDDIENPEFIYLNHYPHFRRSSDPDDLDGDSGDYIIPIVEIEETESDIDESKFSTSLKHSTLVENYYNEVDGEDNEKLKLGLKFLEK